MAWAELCKKGGDLVKQAGSVQLAAKSLWEVREDSGLNHLQRVEEPYLDTVLHPDLLEYLRDVRRRGIAARFLGERKRCQAKIHPNGRRNLAQVYRQIWKDVCKLRVLVVPSAMEEMGPVISSPFDAVDKMLPDRSIAPDKRIVHDQRVINCGTDKEWHPPAVQPRHEQVARLVLRAKAHLPGIEVLMSKKDVAGAFRLLWVDPNDADLFAGDLPWVPEEMENGDRGDEGVDLTVIYLVSSFGFSGSPGEWTVWGKATEEFLRSHRPACPRRDLSWGFESRILVDDNVVIEPWVGLRPWVAGEVYELGVQMMLGEAAVNREKDLIEGPFRTFQTVWGLDMGTATEEIHLPERRILKGANLLSEGAFEYGNKDITVRTVQRFRGITTGWTVIVRGLKNELKVTIGAIDWTNGTVMRMPAIHDQDEVVIHVAEMLSFLAFACHVGHRWSGKVVLYGGDNKIVREWIASRRAGTAVGRLLVRILNLLEMRHRFLLIPAWWRTYHNIHADYITRCTDAEFEEIVKARGWEVVDVRESLQQAVNDSERFGPCLLAWGDEDRRAMMQLKERRLHRSIPHTLKPAWESLGFVELCGPSRLVADFCDVVHEAGGLVRRSALQGPVHKGEIVMTTLPPDVHGKALEAVVRACVDGPACLAVIEGPRGVDWDRGVCLLDGAGWDYEMAEFVTTERVCVVASGSLCVEGAFRATTCRGILGPPMSSVLRPTKGVPADCWITPQRIVVDAGIPREPLLPFLKGHFWNGGERYNLISTGGPLRWPLRDGEGVQDCIVWDPRGPPGSVRLLLPEEVWACQGRSADHWKSLRTQGWPPETILAEGSKATGGQTAAALALMAAYLADGGTKAGGAYDAFDDENVNKLLRGASERVAAASGARATTEHEMMVELKGVSNLRNRENQGSLLIGTIGRYEKATTTERDDARGVARRGFGHRILPTIQGYPTVTIMGASNPLHFVDQGCCIMGTIHRYHANLKGTGSDGEVDDGRAAGRRLAKKDKAEIAIGEACVNLGDVGQPFDGEVGAKVDEWIEDNLCGYLAESTTKQYAGVYGKWRAWAKRQGWATEFLDKSLPAEENENKLLGFLGYLGWLGASPATLKQAVFAIKDGHKRGGQGDPTEKMFRLWMLLGALDKRTPKAPRRLGVTPEMIRWITSTFAVKPETAAQEKFDAVMVKAAVLMAWFFMLRAKEYCESNGIDYGMILRGADLKFLEDSEQGDQKGVTMQFRKTKTDQEAYGTCKTMYESGIPGICVVSALLEYRSIAPQRFDQGSEALQPLFRWSGGQMLKRTQVQDLLQRAARGIGLPPERFRSHSLRIGGASALFQATGEIELVKRTGRWSSSAVQRYLHDGETALKGAAAKMARVEQKIHYT
ncbi:unnamed protein product [Symbiodinium microadriaticum]|nr:unnamed protein product [Symbiodinium microadriaticum]